MLFPLRFAGGRKEMLFPLHFAPNPNTCSPRLPPALCTTCHGSKSKFKIKTLEGGFGNLIVNGKSYTDGYKPNTILH
jgi:hypothetical protein